MVREADRDRAEPGLEKGDLDLKMTVCASSLTSSSSSSSSSWSSSSESSSCIGTARNTPVSSIVSELDLEMNVDEGRPTAAGGGGRLSLDSGRLSLDSGSRLLLRAWILL